MDDATVDENAHPAKRRRTTPPAEAAPEDAQQPSVPSFAQPTQASQARGHTDTLQLRLANAAAVAHNREHSADDTERRGMSARPRRSLKGSPVKDATQVVDTPEADTSMSFLGLHKPVRPKRKTTQEGQETPSQVVDATQETQNSPEDEMPPPLPLPPINDPVAVSPGPNAKGIHAKKKGNTKADPKAKQPRRGKQRPPQPRVSIGYWDATIGVGDGVSGDEGAKKQRSAAAPNPVREVPEADGNEDKRRERDRLREQLDMLKKDLRLVEKEEDRMKRYAQKGDGLTLRNPEQVLHLLGRHLLPPEDETPSEPARLADAMMNPIAWLPFGNPSALLEATTAVPEDEDSPPPLSHHPIEQSAEDELPFLQLLSPFTLSQKTSLIRSEALTDPLHQQHTIDITSTVPRGAFSTQVQLTVDTNTLAITKLSFPRLDPAAAPELRPFLDDLCRKGRTRSLVNNVSVATWAMGEWCRVAMQRAAFWRLLEDEMGAEDAIADVAGRMHARRRYKARAAPDDEDEPMDWKVSEVLPYMGQTYFEVQIPSTGVVKESEAFVRMQWRIAFDWTGDARSELSVLFGIPGKWVQADDRGALGNVAGLWRNLIDGGEKPITVVRTLVALLVGDQA